MFEKILKYLIMKKNLLIVLLALVCQLVYSQEYEMIKYCDNLKESYSGAVQQVSMLPKGERLSSRVGRFEISGIDILPVPIQTCVMAAVDIWEPVIVSDSVIRIQVLYESLPLEHDIEVDVQYLNKEGIRYPACYLSSKGHEYSGNVLLHSIIHINSNTTWNYSNNGESPSDNPNLTTAILRAIATTMGFGSSIQEYSGNPGFQTRDYSVFDNLIFASTGQYLKDIKNNGRKGSTELTNFVEALDGVSIYAYKNDDRYKMYAPGKFEPFRSLVYLNNQDALMHYNLYIGSKNFRIDDVTMDLLSQIGWNLKKNADSETKTIEIVGEGIDSTGIASAYVSHRFNIENHTQSVVMNPEWKFELPLRDGNLLEICSQKTADAFVIPAITDENQYQVNINGDIYGIVTFSCLLDGKAITKTYRISLELRPRILNVEVKMNIPSDLGQKYTIDYKVEYRGANYFRTAFEEEYSSKILWEFIYEPFYAELTSLRLNPYYYSWIDIKVENQYGSDVYTITLPPLSESLRNIFSDNELGEYTHIDVYNQYGLKVMTVYNENELSKLAEGLYFVNYMCGDELLEQSKYLKK